MGQNIEQEVQTIFYNVQFKKNDHPQHIKKLTTLYEKTDLDTFWGYFLKSLKVPLTMTQQHPRVINTLEFCAKFSISFYSFTENEAGEPMSPFISKLFDFLLTYHSAKDKVVRFRICHFLNMLLNSMGDHAFIDDNLCDRITISMTDRLLDKSPKVRAQAVFALYRLQDPADENCPIIKLYLFHVSKDPSTEVRKAILATMGKNQKTLKAVFKRTRDINDTVRKMAYEFISKITVRSLSIEQRERLLKEGLKDRSESVRTCVSNVLLPAWLRFYQGNYIKLVHALDGGIGSEAGTLALQTLFKNADMKSILEQVPVDKNTRVILLSDLSNENILYWKCVIQYLQQHSCTEELELIIPELSAFCEYIRSFTAHISAAKYELWEKQCHKFILVQLFEICKTYDLSDEVGRKNLNEVIIDTLMSDYCSDNIIECVISHLAKVIPDTNNMLSAIANVINEIRLPSKEVEPSQQISTQQQHENNMKITKLKVKRLELEEELYEAIKKEDFLLAETIKETLNTVKEQINQLSKIPEPVINDDMREEKNDPETMVKCLNILCASIEAQTIRALTPTLRSLMYIVLDSLDHPNDNVHILALKALGLYCILDKEIAKERLMIFFYQFSMEQENQEIWIIALKAIFDLLLVYGLEYFQIPQNSEESSVQNKTEKSRILYTKEDDMVSISRHTEMEEGSGNFIKILMGLLDNANQALRTIAAEGLCKLLLNQRINSNTLVSRLIILCYNPVNVDDIYLRQCLSGFFDHFVQCVPDAPEMLENAYFMTLRVLCNAPEISPLQEIDTCHVSRFMLSLTRERGQKPNGQTFYTHNNLAFSMLAEILNPESKIDQETLIKSLSNLDIQIEDETSKRNLQQAIENVTNMIKDSDKRLLKYVQEFKKRLEDPKTMEIAEAEEIESD